MLPSPDEGDGSDIDDEDEDGEQDKGDDDRVEESLDDESSDDRHAPIWLGVLPNNLVIVATFRRCQPQVALGMGVLWQGVSASEIRAACLLSRVKRKDWLRVLDGVQLMAHVVAGVRNDKEAERAKAKK